MITPEILARINALAKKQRAGSLSYEEREEQARLRRLYIDNIKSQIKQYFEPEEQSDHDHSCTCGCHGKH